MILVDIDNTRCSGLKELFFSALKYSYRVTILGATICVML